MTNNDADLSASSDPYADPAEFWRRQGQHMLAPWDPILDASPEQARAEQALQEVLLGLDADGTLWLADPDLEIFEAGCGRGRLAHFFTRNFPEASYSAIDVGPLQLAEASRLVPQGRFTEADLLTYREPRYETDRNFEGYGLVVASEVLMHIRPGADIRKAINQLLGLVRLPSANEPPGLLLLIEWTPLPEELATVETAYWNFPHDYSYLLHYVGAGLVTSKRTDRQTIYVFRP